MINLRIFLIFMVAMFSFVLPVRAGTSRLEYYLSQVEKAPDKDRCSTLYKIFDQQYQLSKVQDRSVEVTGLLARGLRGALAGERQCSELTLKSIRRMAKKNQDHPLIYEIYMDTLRQLRAQIKSSEADFSKHADVLVQILNVFKDSKDFSDGGSKITIFLTTAFTLNELQAWHLLNSFRAYAMEQLKEQFWELGLPVVFISFLSSSGDITAALEVIQQGQKAFKNEESKMISEVLWARCLRFLNNFKDQEKIIELARTTLKKLTISDDNKASKLHVLHFEEAVRLLLEAKFPDFLEFIKKPPQEVLASKKAKEYKLRRDILLVEGHMLAENYKEAGELLKAIDVSGEDDLYLRMQPELLKIYLAQLTGGGHDAQAIKDLMRLGNRAPSIFIKREVSLLPELIEGNVQGFVSGMGETCKSLRGMGIAKCTLFDRFLPSVKN